MLKKVDHIGIAVSNLQQVQETYHRAFGLMPDFEEERADQGVKILGYHIGDMTIEFLEPDSSDSPVANYIKSRGNSMHHIAFGVEDLENKIDELLKKDFILIDEKPRQGADGKKIAFLHPRSFEGILIELCEI
jgi:methylmalonyl-CoA/ethylmalonyl-CoA epimerase